MMHKEISVLGESPVFHKGNWYYLDIVEGKIYKQGKQGRILLDADSPYVSNLVATQNGFLVTRENDIYVTCDEFRTKKTICTIDQSYSMRTNDGGVGPDGQYWFGTMEKKPSGVNGKIYSLDNKGRLLDQGACIGIPNSFIWITDKHVLISDSFLKQTFKVELLENGYIDWENRELWLDLSRSEGTPDGGALDENGDVWLAVWGSGVINKYSPNGNLITSIKLEALQPTSCAFGGVNMDKLFITTATEGMSPSELKSFPESGKIICMDTDVKGSSLPVFKLDGVVC